MKKGDDVADDDNDDAMRRTSVSQDRVTETLYSEELFHITQYKSLSTSQIVKNVWGWGTDSQNNTFSGHSWVSHLPAGLSCDIQGF